MIISASRRTDIPAFYGPWFMNRVRAGYFVRVNPYNKAQRKAVSLKPDDVDLFVFWTKNPLPFLGNMAELASLGYRFTVQMTLNDYPRLFEPGLPSVERRIDAFRRASELVGPERIVWRYDPVIVSTLTPVSYHLEVFERLADAISPYARRVTMSLLDLYGKVRKRLRTLAESEGVEVSDLHAPGAPELPAMARGISAIARTHGLQVRSCSEKADLSAYGIPPGACIDREQLGSILGLELQCGKDKYQRAECLCSESVDMGMYDTCRFGCLYCYASAGLTTCLANAERHDPAAESLLP